MIIDRKIVRPIALSYYFQQRQNTEDVFFFARSHQMFFYNVNMYFDDYVVMIGRKIIRLIVLSKYFQLKKTLEDVLFARSQVDALGIRILLVW